MLEYINTPQDIKRFSDEQISALADEIRESIIAQVSRTGGHLASNLGAVELTIALHRTFDCPKDKLLLDRKSTRLNSSHIEESRMPSSA